MSEAGDSGDLAEGTLTVTYNPQVLEFRQAVEGEFLKRDTAAMVETAGFSRVSATNFSGGVCALHQGWAI